MLKALPTATCGCAIVDIDREQRAVVGHCDGIFELTRAIAPAAETGEKAAVRRERLNPMVVEVGGEQIPLSIDGHGGEPAVEGAEDVQGERACNRSCGKVKYSVGVRGELQIDGVGAHEQLTALDGLPRVDKPL